MSVRQGLRVAFMGAGGTGKTTSADFISKELGLAVPESASRSVYKRDNLTEAKVLLLSSEEKLDLQTAIFDQKVKNDQEFSYVTDRTILDHYAYCLAYCASDMTNDRFLAFENQVRTLMKATYSHLYYFPWGYWDGEEDGIRSSQMSWQSQIDAIMVGYSFRWDLPVIQVPQSQGEDVRNQFILNDIQSKIVKDSV